MDRRKFTLLMIVVAVPAILLAAITIAYWLGRLAG